MRIGPVTDLIQYFVELTASPEVITLGRVFSAPDPFMTDNAIGICHDAFIQVGDLFYVYFLAIFLFLCYNINVLHKFVNEGINRE